MAIDWLFVGLGNPGKDYSLTRHNAGFRCLNALARDCGVEFDGKQSKAHIATAEIAGKRVVLAKPQTWMNLSGESVVGLMRWYKLEPTQLVVVYDEMDLPLGAIRLREAGSAGGHNGMKSIIQLCGTDQFARLRVGVDRAPASREQWSGVAGSRGGSGRERPQTIDHVLSRFPPDEEKIFVELVLPRAVETLKTIAADGVVAAMNRFNGVVE